MMRIMWGFGKVKERRGEDNKLIREMRGFWEHYKGLNS